MTADPLQVLAADGWFSRPQWFGGDTPPQHYIDGSPKALCGVPVGLRPIGRYVAGKPTCRPCMRQLALILKGEM